MRGLKKKRMKRDIRTHRQTHGHRDSMIELAQWADSIIIIKKSGINALANRKVPFSSFWKLDINNKGPKDTSLGHLTFLRCDRNEDSNTTIRPAHLLINSTAFTPTSFIKEVNGRKRSKRPVE